MHKRLRVKLQICTVPVKNLDKHIILTAPLSLCLTSLDLSAVTSLCLQIAGGPLSTYIHVLFVVWLCLTFFIVCASFNILNLILLFFWVYFVQMKNSQFTAMFFLMFTVTISR